MPPLVRAAAASYLAIYIIWSEKKRARLATDRRVLVQSLVSATKQILELQKAVKIRHDEVVYLLRVLDDNEVEIDEFDRIALEAILNQ